MRSATTQSLMHCLEKVKSRTGRDLRKISENRRFHCIVLLASYLNVMLQANVQFIAVDVQIYKTDRTEKV